MTCKSIIREYLYCYNLFREREGENSTIINLLEYLKRDEIDNDWTLLVVVGRGRGRGRQRDIK